MGIGKNVICLIYLLITLTETIYIALTKECIFKNETNYLLDTVDKSDRVCIGLNLNIYQLTVSST